MPEPTTKVADKVRINLNAPARITSETLFNKVREVIIEHEGEEYKLRITANNKLILTK